MGAQRRDVVASLPAEQIARLRACLLDWYRASHRPLPWRATQDPYRIWLSEVMLQQTRVETVVGYYHRFLKRFPDVESLAQAPLDDVLALWSGLGYYSRARNLHAAARAVCQGHGGRFPNTLESLRTLPGVGAYTAGAIASIAMGQSAPLVDGNVIRVFSRLFAWDRPIYQKDSQQHFWSWASQLIPTANSPDNEADVLDDFKRGKSNDAGDFNQALMELGATVCLPAQPTCMLCPVRGDCLAYQQGHQGRYPQKKKVTPNPLVRRGVVLLLQGDALFVVQRPLQGLWGGLFEPPTVDLTADSVDRESWDQIHDLFAKQWGSALPDGVPTLLPAFEHLLTHRRFVFFSWVLDIPTKPSGSLFQKRGRWVKPDEYAALGLAAWVKKLLVHMNPPPAFHASIPQREH